MKYSKGQTPVNYISDKTYSREDFIHNPEFIIGDTETVKLLTLYDVLSKEYNCLKDLDFYEFHYAKVEKYVDEGITCFLHKECVIFKCTRGSVGEYMFRIYNYQGSLMTQHLYHSLFLPIHGTNGNGEKLFSQSWFSFRLGNGQRDIHDLPYVFKCDSSMHDEGMLFVKDGQITEYYTPDTMYNSYILNEGYLYHQDCYFDYSFHKIPVNIVIPKVEETINNYMLEISPTYDVYLSYPQTYKSTPIYKDDTINILDEKSLNNCMNQIDVFNGQRKNHIKDICKIGLYYDDNGEGLSLYLFKCRPMASCDLDGNIDYNFDVNNIVW